MTETPIGRAERKRRTRAALLDSAFTLLTDRGLATLSLREIARHAGVVPTAFYRHFESMEELGLALVGEATRTLRRMVRHGRSTADSGAIDATVRMLRAMAAEQGAQLGFLMRERTGGIRRVREAIATELRLLAGDLATDLARVPGFASLGTDDLRMAANLMVNAMISTVLGLLDCADDPEQQGELERTAAQQLRLIVLGMRAWRSTPEADRDPK